MSRRWTNHAGTQSCLARGIVAPSTRDELVDLVCRAERQGVTVRAVGAGHAWSDIALTDGYVVLPDDLGGVEIDPDDGSLRGDRAGERLVRVRGGTHIRALNASLDRAGLALFNMGGYDAQTLAGVCATSTHGSGLRYGPFPDAVRSLELVVSRGRVVRVEPADGITDGGRFDGELIQDDDVFDAAICGLGTLGLVDTLVIAVREKFWLDEVRTLSTWPVEREKLRGGVLEREEHWELFLNPYGTQKTLVTVRTPCPEPSDLPLDLRERHPLTELESRLPLTGALLRLLARHAPGFYRRAFDSTLHGMRDDGYADVSYRVFNIGEANKLPAVSMELGVPLAGDAHIEAVDRIIEIAAREAGRGRFHTSPIALRFVKASRALVSMMHARDTMMIELILVTGTKHGEELLSTYERELADLGARPHWGQINHLTPERAAALWPRWDDWRRVEADFNSSGVFDSPFTRRVRL